MALRILDITLHSQYTTITNPNNNMTSRNQELQRTHELEPGASKGDSSYSSRSSSMEESSAPYEAILTALHVARLDDEEEDIEDEDQLDPEYVDLRWGESSSSLSNFSFAEVAQVGMLQVSRKPHNHHHHQAKSAATFQDSFYSTTTTVSTSSLDTLDSPPIQPKRRLISFSEQVEVREFLVTPNHPVGNNNSAGAKEEEEESEHSHTDELPWVADGVLETLQRCPNSLLVSESDALMPPSSSSSGRRIRDVVVDDDCV